MDFKRVLTGFGAVMICGGLMAGEAPVRLTQAGPQTPVLPGGMTRVKNPEVLAPVIKEDEGIRGVPEILVEGLRATNTDIKRTEDDPQPYVVFSAEQIRSSQAVDLEDFLRRRLPMNTAASRSSQGFGAAGTASSINLRGLGTDETLILIDGRRVPRIAIAGTMLQPDLNGVPMAAIERIEVLPSTAGGIYGGSANGGVINIVMKHDYEGVEVGGTYANTFDSDAASKRVDLSAGFNFEDGRTRVTVAAGYSDTNDILVRDRADLVRRSRELTLRNNPGAAAFAPPLGGTVNLLSAADDDEDLVADDLVLDADFGGVALNSTFTHIPLGYAGPESDGGSALLDNAGSYNLDLPDDLGSLRAGLVGASSMRSLAVNLRREFSDRFEAFVDLSTLGNKGSAPGGGLPNSVFLDGAAPNNPFQQAIFVTFPVPNLSIDNRSEARTVRAGAGLIVRLPRNWVGEADVSWSRASLEGTNVAGWLTPDGNLALNTGESPGPGLPALNALQEGNTFPIDFGPYLVPQPSYFQGPQDTVLRDATLRLSGAAFRLPGGPLMLSALAERREENTDASFDRILDIFDDFPDSDETLTYYPRRLQNVDSLYLEARAPLISRRNRTAFARELELQTSVRHDRYKTVGDPSFAYPPVEPGGPLPTINYSTSRFRSTDYTVGLRFAPIEDVALRASFGTGFLPPSTTQVGFRRSFRNAPLMLEDPARGFTEVYVPSAGRAPIELITGGSPTVRPEDSESWSAGVIFTPRFLPGLRVSVDYTRIEKTDEIRAVGRDFILANESIYSDRIRRDPALRQPGDPAGWADPIAYINNTAINVSSTELQAYDFQIDYDLQSEHLGTFRFSTLATWQPDYVSQILPDSDPFDSVGHIDGPLEWRGNVGIVWTRGPVMAGWNVQYYDSYRLSSADPETAFFYEEQILNQGTDTIDRQMYHDVVLSYRFGAGSRLAAGLLADTEISLGIKNVLNQAPPILAELNPAEPFSPYGDPRLRRYTISLRKSF